MKSIKTLKSAWEVFVSNQIVQDVVEPLIADSWKRCAPRLNPRYNPTIKHLSPDNRLAAQISNFGLISIARPIMEDTYQYVEGTDTVVVLVNTAGYILDLLGDLTMRAIVQDYDLKIGSLLSEGQMGTNAFSLALLDRIPASVVGPQHFLELYHPLAEAACPIFDPFGRSLGAIGFVTTVKKYHPHTLGLTVAGARAIEGLWQSDLWLQEQNKQLAELNAIMASISEGILVWNEAGILMNANAASTKILDCPSESLVGRHVNENIQFPNSITNAIDQKESLTDVETNLVVNGETINCVLSLRFASLSEELYWTILTLREAEEVRQLVQHQLGAQSSVSINDLVGESPAIQKVRRLARAAAPAKASVLIRGEGGTGKDFLARAIHNESSYRSGPFIIFACSTVPNELVVEELLGQDETGTLHRLGGRPSKFELAQGGTLFFQDVDSLPIEAQTILLNCLELGILQRLGGTRPIELDVRIIAASSAHLERLVANGNFRADLFYRLSPFEINLPPIRDRSEDIPHLINKILDRLIRQQDKPIALADGVIELLVEYHWPGNMRELEAVLERSAFQAGASETIGPMHIPASVRHPNISTKEDRPVRSVPSLTAMERELIIQAARSCNGNVSQMAKVLGIGRTTVWRKMRDLNISADYYRKG